MNIISYATSEPYYFNALTRLSQSARAFGYTFHAHVLDTDYFHACWLKPLYIAWHLDLLNQPVIWLDADSVIHKDISGFDAEIGAVKTTHKDYPMWVSMLCFWPTAKAQRFLKAWYDLCRSSLTITGDHDHFLKLSDMVETFPEDYYQWQAEGVPYNGAKVSSCIARNAKKKAAKETRMQSEHSVLDMIDSITDAPREGKLTLVVTDPQYETASLLLSAKHVLARSPLPRGDYLIGYKGCYLAQRR